MDVPRSERDAEEIEEEGGKKGGGCGDCRPLLALGKCIYRLFKK